MNAPNRLQQIETIFHDAREQKPAERTVFLAKACAGDQSLLAAVNALLTAHDQSARPGDQDYAEDASDLASAPTRTLPEVLATQLIPDPINHSSGGGQRGFVTGAVLAGRYRIVGLLGRGGMGEVYKAEDLKLEQTVALKFLPAAIALDGAMLARFHNEVRVARQIAHPAICRVYDIGEVQTEAGRRHFLSMEFIDGEDLSSLLRRIGRLPGDKATEIARQICAGLAAAHEQGVLHRDLKPANVMIDGRGKARITDFGLAVVSEELRGEDVMAGTPAYMAPEQLLGKEVTQRSDIYALGLVLYELFTGKRVFETKTLRELIELHEKSVPPTPSSHVKEIDPLAERVIMRCLEKDPKARPSSAVQVALALPGGDPLQAALAMGETPSPEMVAASGQKTGLRPQVAVACLLAVIIGLAAVAHLRSRFRLIDVTPFENPPEVLSRKAREIIAGLGYSARPADTAYGFDYDRQYLNYVRQQVPASNWWQRFGQGRPAPIFFWCRESPHRLLPTDQAWSYAWGELPDIARVKENDSPPMPGSVSVRLDMQGRLIRFSAVPSQLDEEINRLPGNGDWAGLFSAAGIDAARLTPTEPKWTPPSAFDARAAWTGTFTEQPDLALRVEAAAWRGRPIYFEVIGLWATPDRGTTAERMNPVMNWATTIWILAMISLGGMLAWRNLRQGRSDRKGAFRLTAFVFLGLWAATLLGSRVIINNLAFCFVIASMIWMLYIGLEPYVRRRWPVMLISWSRVLAGNFRDPLVGRDVLVGLVIGTLILLSPLPLFLSRSPGLIVFRLSHDTLLETLSSTRLAASKFVFLAIWPVAVALMFLFLLFLTRLLVRRDFLAAGLFVLFLVVGYAPGDWQNAAQLLLSSGLTVMALMRYGLVTLASTWIAFFALSNFPATLNFSQWYAGTGLVPLVAVLSLAAFACYTSLGGQKVLAAKLLEECADEVDQPHH